MAVAGMLQPAGAMQRKLRRPSHPFHLRTRPWQIQPFMLAPVLPGETMKNLMMQSRVVTDPIANALIGWWNEYYWFYVKHRDLDGRDDFTDMMLDVDKDMSAYDEAQNWSYYHSGPRINWTRLCLKRVVEEFFRDEGEAWDAFTIGGLPVASINQNSWLDSVLAAGDYSPSDVNVDLDADTNIMASEVHAAMQAWSHATMQGLTEMSYEEWLRQYGVRAPLAEEAHRPELLRYVRDWTYPTNTVDPSTGSPSSACSWSHMERADKARYFSEPGFVLGVTVCRPKVYLRNLEGALSSEMIGAMAWLPPQLQHDWRTSIRAIAQGEGPFQSGTDLNGYVVDLRDLLVYGDQFLNFDPASVTDANLIDLPGTDLSRRYPDADDADGLFADTDPGTAIYVKQDGVCNLNIASVQKDHSPRTPA